LDIDKYNELHQESSNFLKETLSDCTTNNIKSVVITHHMPFYELTHEIYRNSALSNYSQWFNAQLDDLIEENKSIIKAYIYGRTHAESVQNHFGVDFCCNPVGYTGENKDKLMDLNKVFELL
jgi:hypothetical protein